MLAALERTGDCLCRLVFAALKGLWQLLFVTEQGPEKVSFDNCKPLKQVGKSINRRGRACTTNGFCLYFGFAYVPILSMFF